MIGRKVIAVIGATGAQGGGLVRAILNDPKGDFSARVLTRDVNGARAKNFARLDAEVVNADIDNSESLKKAFRRRLRGLLRNLFLGASLAREGNGGSKSNGGGSAENEIVHAHRDSRGAYLLFGPEIASYST